MANINKYFTLNNINDVIEIFEDFLRDYDVRIPASDKEMEEDNAEHDNDALIYGMVYGDLEDRLLGYFERLSVNGTVPNVVNSWDSEVETWEEEKKI